MRKILVGLIIVLGVLVVLAGAGYVALRRGDIPYATLEQTYANSQSHYAELPNGVRIHYRDQGSRTGPTLVLVHGFSASLHTWEPWVERLGDRYRMVTLDLPGHGLTSAPADYRPSIEQYAREIEAFAAAQNLSRFTLIGNSMGGNVAWEYALAHPGRLEALVLVDSSGWPSAETANSPLIFKLMQNPTVRPIIRDLDRTSLVREALRSAFADPNVANDAMVRRYVELARAPGHREILLQMFDFSDRRPATRELLGRIGIPTLIMHGERDNLIPVEDGRKFAAAIPGSELVTWADEGHIPMEEHPDRSAEALTNFLARALAQRTPPAPPPAQPNVTQAQ